MKSYEQIAKAAFLAHVQSMQASGYFKNCTMPTWERLDKPQRDAWVQAAKAAQQELAQVL